MVLPSFSTSIPLVDHDDAGLARLVSQTGHLGVLIGDTVVGIDHNEADIRPIDGHGGAQNGELLHPIDHL